MLAFSKPILNVNEKVPYKDIWNTFGHNFSNILGIGDFFEMNNKCHEVIRKLIFDLTDIGLSWNGPSFDNLATIGTIDEDQFDDWILYEFTVFVSLLQSLPTLFREKLLDHNITHWLNENIVGNDPNDKGDNCSEPTQLKQRQA